MTRREQAKELFYEIAAIYASRNHDNEADIVKSWTRLENALEKGVTREVLIKKVHELNAISDSVKSKPSTIIMNRYWEKQYLPSISTRKFKYD